MSATTRPACSAFLPAGFVPCGALFCVLGLGKRFAKCVWQTALHVLEKLAPLALPWGIEPQFSP